jgi:hypothetical protein
VTTPGRPAGYLPAGTASDRQGLTEAARHRGWPAPVIYAGDDESGSTLDQLMSAISAGRHDALLLTWHGGPAPLMQLLLHCTRRGVPVSFVPLPERTAIPAASPDTVPLSPAVETWDVLARARLEALAGLFPAWLIWLDQHGWHARRRVDSFLQVRRPGAPAFFVQASTATDLAAQLCWQQAADEHAPDGCQATVSAREDLAG